MTTNNFFETKEQYLAFRKAWSNAVNDPRAKPRLEDDTDWDGTPIRVKVKGWLTGSHHMLYNIARGREFDHGFTFIRKRIRLLSNHYLNEGIYHAHWKLQYMVDKAKRIANDDFAQIRNPKERKAQLTEEVNQFLKPFAGTITLEQLASITPERLPVIMAIGYCCHSKSQEIRKRLLDGEDVSDEEIRAVQRNREVNYV